MAGHRRAEATPLLGRLRASGSDAVLRTATGERKRRRPSDDYARPSRRGHTTGLTPGSAVTSSRNLAPRISKLRYWSNDAQAGDSNTTGSASPEASASRAELATATSSVSAIS